MKIVDLAYSNDAKEHEIMALNEENGDINYKILTLKSAKNIGSKIINGQSNLKFTDSERIVYLDLNEQSAKNKKTAAGQSNKKQVSTLSIADKNKVKQKSVVDKNLALKKRY